MDTTQFKNGTYVDSSLLICMVLLEHGVKQYDHHSKELKTSDESQDSEGQASKGPNKRHMFLN